MTTNRILAVTAVAAVLAVATGWGCATKKYVQGEVVDGQHARRRRPESGRGRADQDPRSRRPASPPRPGDRRGLEDRAGGARARHRRRQARRGQAPLRDRALRRQGEVRLRQGDALGRGEGRPRRVRHAAQDREQERLRRDPGPHRQRRRRVVQREARQAARRGGATTTWASRASRCSGWRRSPTARAPRSRTTGPAKAAPQTAASSWSSCSNPAPAHNVCRGRSGLAGPPFEFSEAPFRRARTDCPKVQKKGHEPKVRVAS